MPETKKKMIEMVLLQKQGKNVDEAFAAKALQQAGCHTYRMTCDEFTEGLAAGTLDQGMFSSLKFVLFLKQAQPKTEALKVLSDAGIPVCQLVDGMPGDSKGRLLESFWEGKMARLPFDSSWNSIPDSLLPAVRQYWEELGAD